MNRPSQSLFCRQTGKHSHPSQGSAEAHLRSVLKMRPDYRGHIYPCTFCLGFHVGRNRKNAHINKYKQATG